jgi:ribokinase
LNKPRILVVGSFVMDLIVTTGRFPEAGETVLGKTYKTAPGGKGANQAVQASLLGAAVTMLGKVGNDVFGRELLDSASKAGIDVSYVLTDAEASSAVGNVQIEYRPDGSIQNRIIVVPGANNAIQKENVSFLQRAIREYDMVMLQLEIPMEINELVAGYAKAAGVPIMLNAAPAATLSDKILAGLDYISPNEYEAAALTGVKIDLYENGVDKENLKAAAEVLLAKGVKNVIITLGGNGAVLVNREEFIFCPCVKNVRVEDPTAAGDSFVGAFCTGRCIGLGHAQALEFASQAAAITVSRLGAQPSLPDINNLRSVLKAAGNKDFGGHVLDVLQ